MSQTKKSSERMKLYIELDESEYEEIRSVLAKNGRPDLIAILEYNRDDDYEPEIKDVIKHKKESYEYDEGSCEEEFYSSEDVVSDSNGFLSLK